jgi:hypothetical protein
VGYFGDEPWDAAPQLMIDYKGNTRPGLDDAHTLGDVTHRWKAVYAAGGVIATSDGRWKEDVTDLPYGLDEINQLRPVTFRWKDSQDDDQHYGLIAQEVAEVLPEVVVTGDDPDGILGMNYAEIVPVLVKAVQEQQEQIEDQEAQIQEMEARLQALESGGAAGLLENPNSLWLGGLLLGAMALVVRKRTGGTR